MTALAAPRTNLSNKGPIAGTIGVKAATSQTFWNGAMVAVNGSGYLVPAAATAGFRVVGVVDLANLLSKVTTGSNGDSELPVKQGVFPMAMGLTTDVLTQADLFNDVFVLDDQTVGRLPGNGRPIAGQLVKIDGAIAYVSIGGPMVGHQAGVAGGGGAYQGDGSVEAISAAGALSVNTEISTLAVTGTTAYTLADGLFKGQRKVVTVTSGATSPIGTVTPATPSGFATVTALGVQGDTAEFIWTGAAWILASSFGCTFT